MSRALFLAAVSLAPPLAAQPGPANPNILSPPLGPTTPGAVAGPTDTGRPGPAAATITTPAATTAAGVPPRSGIGKRLRRPR